MENFNEIIDLILKHLRQELTNDEEARLALWKQVPQNQQYFDEITNTAFLMPMADGFQKERENLDQAWERFASNGFPPVEMNSHAPKIIRLKWLRYAAVAASLIFMISVAYFVWVKPKQVNNEVTETPPPPKTDALPKSKMAVLILDDGTQVVLDSTKTGVMANQGNIKVTKEKNGMISYSPSSGGQADKIIYNTVFVPKGSDVVYLALSDGSKVWLNANSSIRYPVAFQDERRVEITGEAYFEIAQRYYESKKVPFIVSKGKVDVAVLGTHFNVNAYEDEGNVKVTLLEGSVKVESKINGQKSNVIIKPGEQAVLDDANLKVINNVNISQVMAWKNGKFVFSSTNIQQIMKQMERWYDLDATTYSSDDVREWKYTGEMSRYNNASKVLEFLKKVGGGKFEISGKKITISE
ncbi:MAG: FecR domain-containing protein [Chitinophagaceae bacterium]